MESGASWTIWDRILICVLLLVGAYAIALVAAGLFLGDVVFDPLGFGPRDGGIAGVLERSYLRLVYGILGAVILGWMLTVGGIVVGPLRRRERWAWSTVASSIAAWFVLDTGLSLALGYVGHAVFNLVFVLAFAVPLVAIRTGLD